MISSGISISGLGNASSKANPDTFTTALSKVCLQTCTVSAQYMRSRRSTVSDPVQLHAGFKQVLGVRGNSTVVCRAYCSSSQEGAIFSFPTGKTVWKPPWSFSEQQNTPSTTSPFSCAPLQSSHLPSSTSRKCSPKSNRFRWEFL